MGKNNGLVSSAAFGCQPHTSLGICRMEEVFSQFSSAFLDVVVTFLPAPPVALSFKSKRIKIKSNQCK